jgi:glycosyltransferase involved in cell wall biosynthesis
MTHRIAMISEHASPLTLLGGVDAGGQNVYVDAVSRGLANRGYEVDVFSVCADPTYPEVTPLADGVRAINLDANVPMPWVKDELWPHMHAFRDAIRRFARANGLAYDLIHGNFWMSGWVAVELGRRWSVPVVQIFHATGITKAREQGAADTSPGERIAIERDIVRMADRLIAQCPAEAEELLRDYHARRDQVVVIPSAVDVDRFRPVDRLVARHALEIDASAEVIVYVGRVIPRKDIRNVVRALAGIGARRSSSGNGRMPILIVVGGETEQPDPIATPEIGELRALATELGVPHLLQFAGRRQPDELHLWYSAADVAVTTPWYEPFGLTPLEAMACGTPVIGSRVGGIAFTVVHGETGFLVPPRDPDALGHGIETLLDSAALRDRYGRAGRARVGRSFTWSQVVERTADLYVSLLPHATVASAHPAQPSRNLVGANRAARLEEFSP